MNAYSEMTRDELYRALESFAKSWLAHDGCWFLAAEDRFDLATAIELDRESWRRFAAAEAARIRRDFGLPEGGGLEALERALALRMYSLVNLQHAEWSDDGRTLTFVMDRCRVQEARRRKGLPDFPCRPVGEVEFTTFAATVDPRIRTRCLRCPPDSPEGMACAWEFSIGEEVDGGRENDGLATPAGQR